MRFANHVYSTLAVQFSSLLNTAQYVTQVLIQADFSVSRAVLVILATPLARTLRLVPCFKYSVSG
jgi:hypothetical protein